MKTLQEYFKELRFNPSHHLGLGDIRLTLAQQEELEAQFNKPPVYGQSAKKSANQILYDNGINTGELNDEFNCSMLKAMEEYKDQFIPHIHNAKTPPLHYISGPHNLADNTFTRVPPRPLPPSPGSVDVEEKKDDTDRHIPTTKVDDGITAAALRNRLREANKEIERLKQENERLKESARQDYRVVIEDEVDWYKDRIQVLEEALKQIANYDGVNSHHTSWGDIAGHLQKKAKQALNPKD